MGSRYEVICKECGKKYDANYGGGLSTHLLHCDKCGKEKWIGFSELGEIHLKFIKGLDTPYSIATGESDKYTQDNYPGDPINEDEYFRLIEEFAGKCECGGSYTFDAKPRCPKCRSKDSKSATLTVLYD